MFDDPNPGDVSLVDEVFGQEWSLDGLGDWVAFDDDGDAQTRETNAANEITSITGGSVTPAYDAAGNMISGPSPLDGTVQVHYAYDAWNRLVAVRADDSGEPGDLMAQYEYDGLNRRITKTVYDGEDTTTSEYFYNESWQLLEARTTAGEDTSATHYAWDLSYIDAPIARLFDANADGDFTDAGDAVHYYTFDANQNVTALLGLVETDPGVFEWQVIERYVYTPYGIATVYDADWTTSASATTDGVLYAGYYYDAETGLYHVRNRQYDPSLGTFTTRDPVGYAAGDANLYRYVGSDPVGAVDPFGLAILPWNAVIATPMSRWWPGGEGRVMAALAGIWQPTPPGSLQDYTSSFRDLPGDFNGVPSQRLPMPPMPIFGDPDNVNTTYVYDAAQSTHCACYQGKRIVEIELVASLEDFYNKMTPPLFDVNRPFSIFSNVQMRGLIGVLRTACPPSQANTLLTLEDGSQALIESEGPTSSDMLGQATLIGGLVAAGRSGFLRELGEEALDNAVPGVSYVPIGKRPSGGTPDVTFRAKDVPSAVPPVIYREGRPSPSNLVPRPQDMGDLSFRDSLSNPVQPGKPGPLGGRPVFRPSEDYMTIDTSKLPSGSVVPDGVPPGHVSVRDVPPEVLKDAVVPKPPKPPYGPGASGKFPK